MAQRRPSGDNPLVGVFMVGLLVVVAGAGIWQATKNKPVEGARYGDQTFASREPSEPRPGAGRPTGFVDAFKRLPNDAVALQKAADAEYDSVAEFLSVEELARVDRIRKRNGGSRDAYTSEELATMRRHGLGSWVRAQAIKWSQSDPSFKTAAGQVWSRSSKPRDEREVIDLAARWGEMDRAARQEILNLLQVVERNSRGLTSGERSTLISFAGEDYFADRR